MHQIKITKVVRSGATPAGDMAVLNLLDEKTQPVRVFIPAPLDTEFLLAAQEACVAAAKQRKQPVDKPAAEALKFERVRLAIDPTQKVRIHLDLQGGMNLAVGASKQDIERLMLACQEMLQQMGTGGGLAH